MLGRDFETVPAKTQVPQTTEAPPQKTTFATLGSLKEVRTEGGTMHIVLDRGTEITVIPNGATEFFLYRFEGALGEESNGKMFRGAPEGSSVVIESPTPIKNREVIDDPSRIRLFLYP